MEAPQASLVAQMAENLPAMQETQVWPLSPEEPLENGTATHSRGGISEMGAGSRGIQASIDKRTRKQGQEEMLFWLCLSGEGKEVESGEERGVY